MSAPLLEQSATNAASTAASSLLYSSGGMHPIDLTIIIVYLILMGLVGWWVAKKASRSAESYFLAGKSLPWWIIGVAHGSSGVDITGTMWFVMMLYIYGVKATWLLWVWPLFSVIFRMMYLGTWVRRSNVLTGAEWMRTRFGESPGARLAYLSVVVYALVHVVGFLSYAFRGIGEFTRPFFPWPWPDEAYGTAMLLITGVYCVVGGMYSVVMNDLIQFVLKVIAAIGIAVIAIVLIQTEQIMRAVPAGWDQLFFGTKLTLDWSQLMPELNKRIYNPISQGGDGYSLFMFFTGMLFLERCPGQHGRAHTELRYPARALHSQPSRSRPGKYGHGPRLFGSSFPPDCRHHCSWDRVFQPRARLDGNKGQFRKNSAQRAALLCACRVQRHPDRCPHRVVHEHLCLDRQLRRSLRGE